MLFDIQAVIQSIPYLTVGLFNTVLLLGLGIALSSILGIIGAIPRASRNRFVRWIPMVYVEIFRNTPLIVQIFYLYFSLPLIGIHISAFNCGVIALALHYTAYNIEVFRSGLEAIPHGLHEAGAALGFTYMQELRLVILPLTARLCLPALTNNYVSVLKSTAIVSVIGVVELTFVAQDVIANDYVFMEMYATISALYIILVFGLTWILRRIENRYKIEL